MSVERDAQHGDGEQEGQRGTQGALFGVALVDSPDEARRQQDDVDHHARVEGHSQGVDEEQFEPSAHFYDARHDTVEHGCHEYTRGKECQQGAFGIGVGHLLIVIYQHDGGQAEQVQQMHADTQTGEVGDKNQPAVAVRLVRYVLPLQYQPEDDGGEQGGEGIHLSLHGAEPEGVAEGIGQCTHQSAAHDGDELCGGDMVFVPYHELAHQVRDAPEEEQDAGAAHQCTHVVHHLCHGGGVGGELREEIGHEHEERCAGRVSHFEFIAGGDELRAVPKTCSRLYRHAIDRGCNEECNPFHGFRYPARTSPCLDFSRHGRKDNQFSAK